MTIDRGGTARIQRIAVQRGPGVDGELKIVIDGLPPSVTFTGDKIPKGKSDANLNFTCAADAPVKLHECRVRVVTVPEAAPKGEREERTGAASPSSKRSQASAESPRRAANRRCDVLHLFTAMPTPFAVVGEFEIPYAQRGTTYARRYRLERNGFTGPLTIRLAEKQMRHLQGVQGTTMAIAADVDEFDYPVRLPTFMELGRTSRTVVTAFGEVDDEQGVRHKVCFTSVKPSEQISLIIGPGPLSVDASPAAIAASTEEPVDVDDRRRSGRRPDGPGERRVARAVARSRRRGRADRRRARPSQGTLRLRFTADAGPFNMPLVVRASHGEGLQQVVAETSLELIER